MIYQIWTNFLVFFLAVNLTPGVVVRNGIQGYLFAGGIYVFLILVLPKIIEFFKINVNISSFTIFAGLITLCYFLVMKNVLFGFLEFQNLATLDAIFGLEFLTPEKLDSGGVVTFATLLTTLLVSLNQWLMNK